MTAPPRLIVHVGTQKTGSSSLQKAMRDAADALRAQGVLYPSLARSQHAFKHVSVSRAAKSGRPEVQQAEVDALLQEFDASGCDTLVLSEEALWRSEVGAGAFLVRFRPRFSVEIVACLRRPDLYLESLYSQALRTGADGECRDIATFADDPKIRGRLHYASRLADWEAVADRVVALGFETMVRQGGLVRGFFEAMGLPSTAMPDEVRAKRSPDMNLVLALRSLRERQWPHGLFGLQAAADDLRGLDGLPAAKHVLGRQLRLQWLDRLASELSTLEARWGVRFDPEMPQEAEDPSTEPDPLYLLALVGALSERSGVEQRDGPARRKALRRETRRAERRMGRDEAARDGERHEVE